ncbi:PilN domain-containing protein [Cellulomonas soli]|uniref:PilN domain-containing protein n=1 Tax=Cellulomonas soli TaxID=931535 RepID=UPI003F833AF5
MSAVTTSQRRKGGGALTGTGALPQVNLLPPEVRAARGLRATKRWLGLGLVATLALCVAGYGAALISGGLADAELVEAQAETARLQSEQAQYAEVPVVLNALAQATAARQLGMSTEVQWKPYIDAIAAVLPAGVSIETFTVTAATPMAAAAAPSDPLQAAGMGSIQFTTRSSTVPDVAAWVDALNSVPGFSSAWVGSSTLTSDESGAYYAVSSAVVVTTDAFSLRFAQTEGEG